MDTTNQAWSYQAPASGTGNNAAIYSRQYDFCTDPTLATIRFDVTLVTSATVAGEDFHITVGGTGTATNTAPNLGVRVMVDIDGTWDIQSKGVGVNLGAVAGETLLTNIDIADTVSVEITGLNCASAQALVFVSDGTNSNSAQLDATDSWINNELNTFAVWQPSETHNGGKIRVDNVEVVSATIAPQAAAAWCPDPGEPSFGYNYVEGTQFEDDPSFEFEDYFRFQATSDDADYLAKGWTATPTQDVYTRLSIEALSDNQDAILRFGFSFVDPTPYLSGETYLDTAKGNGETTASYANIIEAVFEELSDDWRVTIERVSSGTRVQIGQAWVGGNPNTPTSFEFGVRSTVGDQYAYVENEAGTVLLEAFGNYPTGDIYQGWVTVEAADAAIDASSALNDNDGSWNSSCIFFNDIAQDDLDVIGSDGAQPNNPETDPPDEAPVGEGLPGVDTQAFAEGLGIAEEAAGWIVALLLFVGLVGGLITFGPIVAGIGGVVAIGMSVAFNLIPVWFLLFLALMAAVVIVLVVTRRG